MLVLGRVPGEIVLIGDDIIVTLEDVRWRGVAISVQEGTRFPYRKHLTEGERFQLAPDVFVELVRVQSSRVRFGFIAPSHVRILRGEVLERSGEDAGGT